MSYLKFYQDERERWPEISCENENTRGRISDAEIELGIRRLARKFNLSLKNVRIEFTTGNRSSCAGKYIICINRDWANWLTIAHELGHTYWFNKYSFNRRGNRNAHGPQLRRLIDRFCAWIMEQKWHLGELAHEVAIEEINATQRANQRALVMATPTPLSVRIQHREEQIARLTRKIKALTTRQKSSIRSLKALQRSLAEPKQA